MNILAIDSLKMNKNLNLRANSPEVSQPPVETPVSPAEAMKALELQGQNNIAFQGLKTAKIPKGAGKLAIALAALAATLGPQSCTKYEYEPPVQNTTINNIYTITINVNQMESLMDYMKQRDEQLFNLMKQWMEMWKQDQMDDATFYENMYNLMLQNTDNQKIIIDLMVQNGKSEEEAKQLIQDLIAEVKAGNMTAAQAYQKIMNELGQIVITLNDILNQLKSMSDDNAKYHEENLAAQNKANDYLSVLVDQGQLKIEYAEKLARLAEEIMKNTSNIVENGDKTVEFIKMYGDKLIEEIRLADENDIKKQDLEKMLAFYGIKIEDAINMSADQLEAAIKTFMERYEKTSAEYNENLASKIDEVNKNLQTLIAQMGSLFNEVKTHNNLSNKYWNATLESINKFTGDVSDMKAAQQISNTYLESLNAKASLMIQKLEELAKANPGLTQEQLEEALSKYGEKAYEQYTDFAISIGLDKLSDKGTAIEETLDQIKAILKKKPEYSAQLDRIIALLELNAGNSTKLEEIKQLLAEFKCNCDCGKDSSENEGILGDLENLVNGN